MWQVVGQLHAAFAMLRERPVRAAQNSRVFLDEGETNFFQQLFGQRLAVQFVEFRFWIEQIQMRWRSGVKDEDTGLGLRVVMRLPRRQWVDGVAFGFNSRR